MVETTDSTAGSSGADLFFHLSGGTTEFLLCRMDDEGYDLTITGGTRDISVGQLIDRMGVAMGLPFPAGPYIDEMALGCSQRSGITLPKVRISDGYFNLSGIETNILRRPEINGEGDGQSALAAAVMQTVTELLAESAAALAQATGARRVFMAGGVASSRYVRENIGNTKWSAQGGPEIIFGDPAYSGDNAAGTARLAGRIYSSRCVL